MLGTDYSTHVTNPTAQGPGAAVASAQDAPKDGSSSFFDDLLDIVNPLQHIPVISTIYRHLTGDKIDTVSKLAGDTLYGGVTGLLCSLGDTLFEQVTGEGVGDTVYAALTGDSSDQTTAVASAKDSMPAAVTPANGLEPLHVSLFGNDESSPSPSFVISSDSASSSSDLEPGLLHPSLFEDSVPAAAQRAAMAYRATGKMLEAY